MGRQAPEHAQPLCFLLAGWESCPLLQRTMGDSHAGHRLPCAAALPRRKVMLYREEKTVQESSNNGLGHSKSFLLELTG